MSSRPGLLLTCAFVALATAASSTSSVAADLAEIESRGFVRVLVMPAADEVRFFNTGAGEPGLDRELVTGFARLHDVELQIVEVSSWGELVPALLGDRGDLIAGAFTATEARRRQIAFSVEVFPTRVVVVSKPPTPPVGSLEDLSVRSVGCIEGSSPAAALRDAGVSGANIDDRIPSGQLLEALQSGQVDVAAMEVPAAILAHREDPDIQLGVFLGSPGSFAYGVRKEDTELLAALNEYLDLQHRGSGWSRLVVKYFGAAAPEILDRARGN